MSGAGYLSRPCSGGLWRDVMIGVGLLATWWFLYRTYGEARVSVQSFREQGPHTLDGAAHLGTGARS